ncbi:hypothetical protein VOLCADRAFT_119285 [Volvox carteri f. nagariensis]|uniref:Uncharacterized protein n=1 Tax=Volvox carteri f. nagariensis TaxID=3068 RepID=D8UBR7_VOLCA|nr:uncharacterized protein VOLCADRAFT_119285 [Volvox carteri f. nagariensis]EFJ42813.1 hypothetical protein VOLCADRAFT_119285 [Volvox carteri f. nagariensis]|eukprot:XP_002956073.1 hypothetical protein VOLCADRAFT_119285 [Volvox carteri f. nagariensis]
MWHIDLQILLLCFIMPPAGSYAIKHIYVGPAAADFTDVDLCLNLFLTLFGFMPGIAHALYLFARHKGWGAALAMDAAFVWLLLLLEGVVPPTFFICAYKIAASL